MLPPSLSWLAPVIVHDLTRIGGPHDGGYVLPIRVLPCCDTLLSMGLGYSWSFEAHLAALEPLMQMQVYDHSVGLREFRQEYWTDVLSTLCGQSPWNQVSRRATRLRRYHALFPTRARQVREQITPANIDAVLDRAPGPLLVKMDIEGMEYAVLPTVATCPRVVVIVLECHDTIAQRATFTRVLTDVLRDFTSVHLHGNNFTPRTDDGLPDCLELTLVRHALIPETERRHTVPIALDSPNSPTAPEVALHFQLSSPIVAATPN